jgi:hypothetical protein
VVAIYISQPSGKMNLELRPEEFMQVENLNRERKAEEPAEGEQGV